jgi:hypothetical protein
MAAVEFGDADRLRTLAKELTHDLKLSMRNQTSRGVVSHMADEIDVGIVQEAYVGRLLIIARMGRKKN